MADVANYSKSMAPFCREAVIRNWAAFWMMKTSSERLVAQIESL